MALYEYDHSNLNSAPSDIKISMKQINEYASMPANAMFDKGVLEKMMADVGFEDVVVTDLTTNVTPMLLVGLHPVLDSQALGAPGLFRKHSCRG